jgi:hypothetical protein
VKNFAQPSFFRLLDLLVSMRNPGLKRPQWTHDGVEFQRERHSFTGPKHGMAIEIFNLTHSGRRGWSLMVIKEYWWRGEESKALKNLRWARPTGGQRRDILAWLKAQDAKISHMAPVERRNANAKHNEKLATIDKGGFR